MKGAGRPPSTRPPDGIDEHLRRRRNGGPPAEGPPGGKRPRAGGGQLQWNTWGWFGGQIGSTIWLLVLGVVAVAQGDALGVIPVVLCLLANLGGTLLWWARDRVAPLAALESLLAAITVFSAGGVAAILEGGLLGSAPDLPPGRWVYLYLLVFPVLMLQLWLVDRAGRGRGGGSHGRGTKR